ncbi:MAG: hypothetical protein ACI3ZC_06125 [Candidatus Cryptobacteroides sp.]
MATGFQKLANKVLDEDPIKIVQAGKSDTGANEVEQEREQVRQPRQRAERPAPAVAAESPAPDQPKRGRKRKGAQMEGLVTVTIQLRAETKSKLEEMKFRSKRLIWELTDEAINDLYNKMYR